MDNTNKPQVTKGRFVVLVNGDEVSSHESEVDAARAAAKIARDAGLVDDGSYCGDDGWPSIEDTAQPWRIVDYSV